MASFTDVGLANAEVDRLTTEVSRISTERNRLAGDVATAQAERATATARADDLEKEQKATWRESHLGRWDIPLILVLIIGSICFLLWYIRAYSTMLEGMNVLGYLDLIAPTMMGVGLVAIGLILTRMLNGAPAEWIGGTACVIGAAWALFMFQKMDERLITVPLHPVTEQHYGDEHYDVLCIEKLDLPKDFKTVDVIVQIKQTLTKDQADKISAKEPWPVKVPKGAEGNVFSQADTQRVPSRSSSYWGLDPKPAKTTPDTTSGE
jgi:hypothetical protein